MKAPKEKRSAQLHILISEQEMDKIRERKIGRASCRERV